MHDQSRAFSTVFCSGGFGSLHLSAKTFSSLALLLLSFLGPGRSSVEKHQTLAGIHTASTSCATGQTCPASSSVTKQLMIASWYGQKFQSRLTANGEHFDKNKLTAANKSLPLGSIVKLTVPTTGRSVIVRMNAHGDKLSCVRLPNDPVEMALEMAKAGDSPEVVIEATYGWYWLVDLLQEHGANVHLAHPSGLKWEGRRVKNDEIDATDLADRLRMHRLPEAWIAPPEVRELRELVRHRANLVALRSGLKAQVHAVMAKQGVLPQLDRVADAEPTVVLGVPGVSGDEGLEKGR